MVINPIVGVYIPIIRMCFFVYSFYESEAIYEKINVQMVNTFVVLTVLFVLGWQGFIVV